MSRYIFVIESSHPWSGGEQKLPSHLQPEERSQSCGDHPVMERSDVTSLLNTLTTSANTALTLLPFIVLFKGAFILGTLSLHGHLMLHCVPAGLFIKDKVGHLLPSTDARDPVRRPGTTLSALPLPMV